MSRIGRALAGIAAMVFLVAGCNESTAPEFDLTVANNPDDFVAQSASVVGGTLDREYTWQNSGTRANVTDVTIINGGVARVVIRDAANVVVYDRAVTYAPGEPTQARVAGSVRLADLPISEVSGPTQVGVAGAWRIEILLSGFSGSLNVRVQKL